jgi:segregation and condensation protein B
VTDEDGVLEFPSRPGGVEPELVAAVEALLFASGDPVSVPILADVLGAEADEVRIALRVLEQRRRDTGVVLERVAGGWQLRTAARFAVAVHRLLGTKPQKLSRPALEVLAAVAWHQPITRSEIERVRGVDSGGVIKALLERGLLRTAGRAEEPGRPLLYRTTSAFLEMFGLPDLGALPTLAERESLARQVAPEADDAHPEPAEAHEE